MKVCKNGHNVPSVGNVPMYCGECGDDLRKTPEVTCPNGHRTAPWDKFCESCGVKTGV